MVERSKSVLVWACGAALLVIVSQVFGAAAECTAAIQGNTTTGSNTIQFCSGVCGDEEECAERNVGLNPQPVTEIKYFLGGTTFETTHDPNTVTINSCTCGNHDDECCDVVHITAGNDWGDPHGWGVSGKCGEAGCPPGDDCEAMIQERANGLFDAYPQCVDAE